MLIKKKKNKYIGNYINLFATWIGAQRVLQRRCELLENGVV